jgi:hypothetical protein
MITTTLLSYYALAFSAVLIIGETLIVLRTKKYWPLSLDDYLVCGALIWTALNLESLPMIIGMLIAWAFSAGNLYAMLFTRMDPQGGSRERLGALTVMLLLSIIGAIMTALLLIQS